MRENFGPSTLWGSTLLGSPPFEAPLFQFLGLHPAVPHPSRAPHFVIPKFNIQKLAEVEINWPKSNRWCLLCFFFLSLSFFFFSFVFLLFFTFFLFLLISLFILFLFCFCFRPQKPELNPALHFRWTLPLDPHSGEPPPLDNPPLDNPRPDNPPPDNPPPAPKISLFFFPLPPQNSFFSSLSGCLLVEVWWCF